LQQHDTLSLEIEWGTVQEKSMPEAWFPVQWLLSPTINLPHHCLDRNEAISKPSVGGRRVQDKALEDCN